jgi:nitroreductase
MVLDGREDVERFWEVTTSPGELPDSWLRGMMTAPVVIIPCSSKAAYLQRYAEPDKGWTDLDETRWPVPFWHMDAAMASLLILLTAVDEGLGACFFGIQPEYTGATRAAVGIPDEFDPVGAITLGHRLPEESPSGSPTRRKRKPQADVIHRGRWTS